MSSSDSEPIRSEFSAFEKPIKAPEAAKILGIGVSTVYRLVETRQLPHIRLGSAIRFRRSTLERLMEAQEAESVQMGGGA